MTRFFSNDYGRTWPERKTVQPATNGGIYSNIEGFFGVEGNALVDRDSKGVATRIAEVGYNADKGYKWPNDATYGILRWSTDGGRSWTNESVPKIWAGMWNLRERPTVEA